MGLGLGLELGLPTNSLDIAHLKSNRVGARVKVTVRLVCIYINRGVYSYHFLRVRV